MTTTTTTMLQLREWKKEERLKRKTEFVLVQKNASLHPNRVLHICAPQYDNTQQRIKSQWSGEEWNARSSITHLQTQTQDSSSLHSGKSFTSTIYIYVPVCKLPTKQHTFYTLYGRYREKMCLFVCGRVENLFLLFTLLSFF